jgi:hypothetical protein
VAAAANAIGQCGGTLRSIERVNSQVRTSAQYHHRAVRRHTALHRACQLAGEDLSPVPSNELQGGGSDASGSLYVRVSSHVLLGVLRPGSVAIGNPTSEA